MLSDFSSIRALKRLSLGLVILALASCTDALDHSRLVDDGVVSRMTVVGRTPEGFDGPHCGGTRAVYGGKGDHLIRARGEVDLRYKVGPGDDLRFNIFGEEGMDGFTARVDAEGYVQLPIIENTRVAGLTTRQIQTELKQAYTVEFNDPWVTVELAKAESHPIYFLGEFRKPGVKYLEFATELIEALALAEGLEEDAYLPGARLIRGNSVCTVDLAALLKNGDFRQNVWMRSGDVIFAPNREDMRVYVLGAVESPGGYAFGAEKRTMLETLALAGGPKEPSAQLQEVRVIRSLSTTRGELIVVDVAAMLVGDKLDFPLRPGDVVYVPHTPLGTWNQAVAEILPSLQLIGGILTPIALLDGLRE